MNLSSITVIFLAWFHSFWDEIKVNRKTNERTLTPATTQKPYTGRKICIRLHEQDIRKIH
jgi:hypothetical protein